jgi:hypothetical protein
MIEGELRLRVDLMEEQGPIIDEGSELSLGSGPSDHEVLEQLRAIDDFIDRQSSKIVDIL